MAFNRPWEKRAESERQSVRWEIEDSWNESFKNFVFTQLLEDNLSRHSAAGWLKIYRNVNLTAPFSKLIYRASSSIRYLPMYNGYNNMCYASNTYVFEWLMWFSGRDYRQTPHKLSVCVPIYTFSEGLETVCRRENLCPCSVSTIFFFRIFPSDRYRI